ncbi:MAG: chemotaxis protein CheV [Nitrospinae bacterium]|nr:chemotaxis protein CheV [Nitrospinota bacterium]
MENADKILLESGTNELEIVEFQIDRREPDGTVYQGYYGVNVGKVREIIKTPDNITEITKSHPAVAGVINLRGRIIPVINLPKWLGKYDPDLPLNRIIVTEFNRIYNGFLVSSVSRIHRVSWERVEPPTSLMTGVGEECVTGIVKFDNKILMMLDFEKIIAEVNPSTGIGREKSETGKIEHKDKTILIAEDSGMIMKLIKGALTDAGYNVLWAYNGEDALKRLNELSDKSAVQNKNLTDFINLVISDIEMPKMDGLHLLSRIKSHPRLKELPVIIFSSMATQDNIKKWEGLGASDFISKPDMNILIQTVGRYII